MDGAALTFWGSWRVEGITQHMVRAAAQNSKTYLKTFSNHYSTFLKFLRRYPIPTGTPSAGALNTQGVGKIGNFRAIFDANRRLSRKRCKIGRWLLWNVNGKSWVPDRMVSFSMALSDHNPRFKVTVYLQVQYSITVRHF